MNKPEVTDEFTGVEAQSDPAFLSEGGDFSADGLSELEELEAQIANEEASEEVIKLDYDNYIILKKADLLKFLRAVEPWVKVSVDQYGKCVRVKSLSPDEVQLTYINGLMAVQATILNRSGKMIPEYFLQVSTFKRLVTETYTSLVLVHENNELNIALLDNILFVETVSLSSDEYTLPENTVELSEVDNETLAILTKKLSFVLASSDRVAEKNVSFLEDKAYLSTSVFSAVIRNPFKIDNFTIPKVCLDLLGIMTEVSKLSIKAAVVGDEKDMQLRMEIDGMWTVLVPVFKLDKVVIERAKEVTAFEGTMEVSNESLTKLVDVVRSFEYLSEVLEFKVQDKLLVNVRSKDLSRNVQYEFPYSGTPETKDEIIRVSAQVVKPYLHLGTGSTKYDFTKHGWGLQTEWGNLLIRKTV